MTVNQFNQLNQLDQKRMINRYGVFVAERVEGGDRLYLYAVNSFYVELLHQLSNINNTGLVIQKVFDDIRYLDVYLEKMDVSRLYT